MPHPPHPDAPINPITIMLAPELAVLAALDELVTIAIYALFAAHPGLGDPHPFDPDPPVARAANQLIDRLHDCRTAASLYRRRALSELVKHHRDDALPF